MARDADELIDPAIDLVERWLARAHDQETATDRDTMDQLAGLIDDPDGVAFTMRFVDRVVRPDDNRVAADQLVGLINDGRLPGFLTRLDRLLLRSGALVAPVLPWLVMPLARRRMRQLVGHLVVDADSEPLREHLSFRRSQGFEQNVNLLGEAVLGEREASRRFERTAELLDQPDVDYVSVKVSAIASQLEPWAWDEGLVRITARLRELFLRAASTAPATFINLDMEEYHDLELTIAAFTSVLDEPDLQKLDAGIVLQAYLPDSLDALQGLVAWSTARKAAGGGEIKIRLVKGANLAMERVDAAIHGWEIAPYGSKADTDANYVRCLDWALTEERLESVRIGVGSHNLFHVALAHLLAEERGVSDRVEFEMLQGMAPAHARIVRQDAEGLLLYTPIVAPADFDVAISYLFRRLEENSAEDNFMRSLFSLTPGSASFVREVGRFTDSVRRRELPSVSPQRTQERPALASHASLQGMGFVNEPDTDPVLASNREWARAVADVAQFQPVSLPEVDTVEALDDLLAGARIAQQDWAATSLAERQRILHAAADELARRRGDLINAMMHEGNKTFAQADPEVSEAIDFAYYYGDRVADLSTLSPNHRFESLGVVAVIPPWNFPVAIPAGGVLAALAAGNTVVFKPAPETPRCAEIVAEALWAAGVPHDVLTFARTPENEVGRHLVTHADGVILTGGTQTADLFRSWKPDLVLFAETSGKNSLVITENADVDLAVGDLVDSAFGHSGQKCSAASLAICVGGLADSPRFQRQLVDAVESLAVGPVTERETSMGPIIGPANERLLRGLTTLDDQERWLVTPRLLDASTNLWSPGVRLGVEPGSWFHTTECFGPVLGIMSVASLDEAIQIQNQSAFGLTGGLHSLDPSEIARWIDEVEVGNAYVNRGITGAIVNRQPFGGWKQSSVGPGAKAGGPNYIAQLGAVIDDSERSATWLERAERSDELAWTDHFSVEHDPTALFCESNVFRYRPLARIAVRIGPGAASFDVERVTMAARRAGVPIVWSDVATESADEFADRLSRLGVERVRIVGDVESQLNEPARQAGIHLAAAPVVADGRVELLHYVREQAVSRTLHRFGNLISV